jgi:hypothetical protein
MHYVCFGAVQLFPPEFPADSGTFEASEIRQSTVTFQVYLSHHPVKHNE